MKRVSLRERMLFWVGMLLLVFCTFRKANALSTDLAQNDDLIHPLASGSSHSPASTVPEPAGVLTLTFVGMVVAHRSRQRWSR